MKHLLLFVVLTVATNAYPSIVSCDKDITLNNLYEAAGEFTEIELQAMDIWRAMNKLIPPDIMIRSEKISKQRKN